MCEFPGGGKLGTCPIHMRHRCWQSSGHWCLGIERAKASAHVSNDVQYPSAEKRGLAEASLGHMLPSLFGSQGRVIQPVTKRAQ